MNKQRNSVLIIVILILVVVAASRGFYSCRSHFQTCDIFNNDNDEVEAIPAVFAHAEEGFQKLDEGFQKMDEHIASIDESIKTMADSIQKADSLSCLDPDSNFRLDTIMYAGYLKRDFPYPIVFHFKEFFELSGFVVMNEVYYPQSLRGKLATGKLDSTNSVNVTLNTSTSYTFTSSSLLTSRTNYSEFILYSFSYPLKTPQGLTVASFSGQFKSKGRHISRGLPMGDSKKIAKDKLNRLKIENAIVRRIREQLSRVPGY